LVGGHCIGVDPYYLAQCAERLGYHPEIILAGRRLNDGMGEYVASEVVRQMLKKRIAVAGSNVLVLGITFKENCPDIRNTKVTDIITELRDYDIHVDIYDPNASAEEVEKEYGLSIHTEKPERTYDAVILAVAHAEFMDMDLAGLCKENSVIYDIKGCLCRELVDKRL